MGNFREAAKLDEMTINELFFYQEIMPVFTKSVEKAGMKADWTPRFYYGFYGISKGNA